MSRSSPRALVLDGRTLSSLAVARSLGRQGYAVDCAEEFRANITSFSKYVDETITYPAADEAPQAFRHAILSALHETDYDVLVPTRDATTAFVSDHQDELNAHTNVYVAPPDVIGTFDDKGETVKLARECGVPTPTTYFPEEQSVAEIKAEADYPVLIRPRRSSGSRGITRVESAAEFDDAYERVAAEFEAPMVQEYVAKARYTTACLLLDDEQRELASFSYERQKEYPRSGGPTVVGESTDDTAAKQAAKELLQAGDWHGPAEVEFIVDQEGTPRLLEVNPRFWMPVQLAISAGVDFPAKLAALARGEAVEPTTTYETGVTYRWVLPYEVLHTIDARRPASGLREVVSTIGDGTCYGALSLTDPGPVLGTVAQSLAFLTDAEKRRSVLDRAVSGKKGTGAEASGAEHTGGRATDDEGSGTEHTVGQATGDDD
ncbi:carboxylate--amine ligase [Natronococcus roseus]|uniref:carboxylate--amine ligase n=1 Tax=Natronococcus roseus TaxID=1052014 RepID=UPI00374CB438